MTTCASRKLRPLRRMLCATCRRLALLALVLACATVAAHERDYYFETLTSANGLAQNSVTTILQDPQGYLWFVTQGGLHRYDGYRLQRYPHDPARADSLPDNLVSSLSVAGEGRLWVGSNAGGLTLFDPASNRIVPLPATVGRPDLPVFALSGTPGGRLLVASAEGIDAVDPPYRQRVPLWRAPSRERSFTYGFTRCPDGQVYATTFTGLLAFDPHATTARALALPAGIAPETALCAAAGELLLGGPHGLFRYHPADGRLARLWPAAGAEARATDVSTIARDHDGRLWLGVRELGLVRLDPGSGEARILTPDPDLPGSLPQSYVNTLFVDRSGLLWAGLRSHGVAFTDPGGTLFQDVIDTSAARTPEGNFVRALYQTPDGALWVGADSTLKRYDRRSQQFTDYGAALTQAQESAAAHAAEAERDAFARALGANDSEPGVRVYRIAGIGDGRLAVATSRGLFQFDPASGGARVYPMDAHASALAAVGVRALAVDRDGSLWLGLSGRGLLHVRDGHVVRHYRHDPADPQSLASDIVVVLAQNHDGRVWAGTTDGLSLIDPASGTIRTFRENPGHPDSLSGRVVTDLQVADDGTLWVGTQSGLNRLVATDARGAHFRRYLVSEGLPDPTVYCVLDDASGQLWISSNLGISRLNPADGKVRSFTLRDGLQGLEYNSNVCLRLRSGELMFGGVAGMDRVQPERLRQSGYDPPVVVTAVQIDNRLTDASPPADGQLRLQRADRLLRVDFAALDFAAPALNRFQYRLHGFDNDWIDAGTRHSATYTNLPAGRYRFEVRGSNHEGVFGKGVAALGVEVMPPWWATRTMRAALALAASLAALLGWYAWRGRRREERRHREQLQQHEDRLRLALWGSGDEFWDWDMRQGQLYRMGADQLLGSRRGDRISAEDWRNFAVHPDDLPRVERALADHVNGLTDHFEAEYRVINARGEWVWTLSRGKVVERDAQGQPLRVCGTARDVTFSRAIERDRRIAAEVIRSMAEAVTVCDLDFRFTSVNQAFTRMAGYGEEEVLGQDATILNCHQHPPEAYEQVRRILTETGHWRGELWQRRKDGEEFLCWMELSEVRDAGGARTHYVGVLSDITDRKRVEQELRYLANYDTLTGLPNRTLLGERLGHAIIRARRSGRKVAVLFLDLDRFKHVNDSMGHAAGDRMLKAAGARLRACVREHDTVARLGGDEFTVVLEDIRDTLDAETMARKLLEAFSAALELETSQEVVISPSIGISLYPDHGQVPTDLLKYADTAMYQAKDRGRNTWMVYTEAMDAQARMRATMIAALRRALERNEFSVVYQPKQSLSDDRITGVEALLRWHSEDLGEIPPSEFIPLAEETGQIVEIGEFVLATACAELRRWREAGLRGLTMAVNLSVAQLTRGELTSHLCDILAEHDVAPDQLELELTESMVMANAEQSVRTLGELKAIGVRVAIDDFGTGYSSLAYLKRLPIDSVKIDKEFVGDITSDPDDEAITATVIAMAHSLGLNVVAEGVETREQLEYLREQNCDEIQGHWLSRPLHAEACLAFLQQRVDRLRVSHL
ncbi:MAG: EAL domain-containing protein [Xanthomonadaceae bacterium]|nr:EAL domain-containing protein [Xanthomonadaceae bacterium]